MLLDCLFVAVVVVVVVDVAVVVVVAAVVVVVIVVVVVCPVTQMCTGVEVYRAFLFSSVTFAQFSLHVVQVFTQSHAKSRRGARDHTHAQLPLLFLTFHGSRVTKRDRS